MNFLFIFFGLICAGVAIVYWTKLFYVAFRGAKNDLHAWVIILLAAASATGAVGFFYMAVQSNV